MSFFKAIPSFCVTLLAFASLSSALPKATELVSDMSMGYNIGNTMEVPGDPTAWGNTYSTKKYIDGIKAAGFNTVRIPTAWFSHSNQGSNTINTTWLDSIKVVVDYCIANNMYVILNSHRDNGWLEDNVFSGTHPDRNNVSTTTDSSAVRKRQSAYWTQIATKFANYDQHLLFASANEPGVNDPRKANDAAYADEGQYTFGADRMKILKAYHQAFVDAVRGAGGNNATRTLIVQAPRTDTKKADLLSADLPTDPAGTGYIMAEFHFYPYQFSLMESDADWGKVLYYWGDENDPTDTERNSSWCGPSYVDTEFAALKSKFTDKGIPVVIGEFGAVKRLTAIKGDALARHLRSRALFYGYVAKQAKANGLIPVIWDTGFEGDMNMTMIRRQTTDESKVGEIVDYEVLNAMRTEYGLVALPGNSIDALVNESLSSTNKSLVVTYDYKTDTTSFGSIRIPTTTKDLSAYTGIRIHAYVSGSAEEVEGEYGFFSMDLAVMTGTAWTWTDTHFGPLTYDSWTDYNFTFTSNSAQTTNADKDNHILYFTDRTAVNAFVIQSYMKNFVGTVSVDRVLLLKADGTADTLETFDKKIPETDGGILTATLVATSQISSALQPVKLALATKVQLSIKPNQIQIAFESASQGPATILLTNAQGKIIARQSFVASRGANTVELASSYRGQGFLVLEQNGNRLASPVHMK